VNPLPDNDLVSYSRLSSRIDTPLAVGSRYSDVSQFVRLLESGTRATFRPDIVRLGGLTPFLKVAALAELHHRPAVPHLLPELGVHLACGLAGVQAVEHVPWLSPLFTEPITPLRGELIPPPRPGLGLELKRDAVERS
jgi:L-alanine-DL-glutamate epimerase-like enolase superfamily enzyme